ncbi:LORF2 protein, partial [Crocuta crocuta]
KWVKDLNRHLIKKDTQMANKYMKRCLTSFTIKELQIKQNGDDVAWQGYETTGAFIHCWLECKMVQPLWKTEFLTKLNILVIYVSSIMLIGIIPK